MVERVQREREEAEKQQKEERKREDEAYRSEDISQIWKTVAGQRTNRSESEMDTKVEKGAVK